MILVGGDGRPSGVPRHILHLVSALKDQAVITVISDRDQGGYSGLDQAGVRHLIVRGLTNRLSPVHLWHGVSGLMNALSRNPADLIWIHARLLVLICRILMALRIWRPDCPVVFTHHGLPYGRGYHPVVHAICRWLEKVLVATCPTQNLVFLNHRMAGWMARDAKATRLARHRVHILPNCSDLRPLTRQRNPMTKILVMTGRTGRQKDYDVAAQLLSHLPENFRLLLCGPGTDDRDFQTHIASIVAPDIFDRIAFVGPVPDARIPLSKADAFLLTSRYEGTPIGALEAFEAGLPIILRNFDGATDLISKHPCGVLFSTRDLAKEAERIVDLLDHFEANEELLSKAIRHVWLETWSPDIFARNARALVCSVLNRPIAREVKPDYIHDVLVQHPDHCKNADDRVPVPPPYYTNALPSAENGSRQ